MRLLSFGELCLEHDDKVITKPYIALLSLLYLTLEGPTNRNELIEILLPFDKGRLKTIHRSVSDDVISEIANTARSNYRSSLSKLRKSLKSSEKIFLLDGYGLEQVNSQILSSDVIDFHELSQSSNEDDLRLACELYERGTFLEGFEEKYSRRNYEYAIELKEWINDLRRKYLELYISAKSTLEDSDTVSLEGLKITLPKDLSTINNVNAKTLQEIVDSDFKDGERAQVLEYIYEYLEQYFYLNADLLGIANLANQSLNIFISLAIVPQPNFLTVREVFSLSQDEYTVLLNDLKIDGFIHNYLEESFDNIMIGLSGNFISNYLESRLDRYQGIVLRFLSSEIVSIQQKITLTKDFLKALNSYNIQSLKEQLVLKINSLVHQLINDEYLGEAIEVSEVLYNLFCENIEEVPRSVVFWYCYALERNGNYDLSLQILNDELDDFEGNSEDDNLYMLLSLQASILVRNPLTRLEGKDKANFVLKSYSSWAAAEAFVTMGRISLFANESTFKTVSFFQKASLLWESLNEVQRQVGALQNIAVTYDLHKNVQAAESAYTRAIELALDAEVSSRIWFALLQNRAVFYVDIFAKVNSSEEFKEKADKDFNEILYALNNDESIGIQNISRAYNNLGYYYESINQDKKAIEYYNKAVGASRGAGMVQVENLALVGAALLECNFDKVEVGLHRLRTGGYQVDVDNLTEQYITKLKELAKTETSKEVALEIEFRLNQLGNSQE